MKIIAKVRYVDFQKRSHIVEIESDTADRKNLEDLVKARYPFGEFNLGFLRLKVMPFEVFFFVQFFFPTMKKLFPDHIPTIRMVDLVYPEFV